MDIFPKEIFQDNNLSSEIAAALKIIQSLYFSFNSNINPTKSFTHIIADKRQFIRELAKKVAFPIVEETFHKKCLGHDVRISSGRFFRKYKAENFGKASVEEYSNQNPFLKKIYFYLKKHPGRFYPFDIRVGFSHTDNTSVCTYPVVIETKSSYKPVIEVLDQFECEVERAGYDVNSGYEVLLYLVSQS